MSRKSGTVISALNILLAGTVAAPNRYASGEVLSGNPQDEYSLDQPKKVAPVPISVPTAGPNFHHVFPAHSVTVFSVKCGL